MAKKVSVFEIGAQNIKAITGSYDNSKIVVRILAAFFIFLSILSKREKYDIDNMFLVDRKSPCFVRGQETGPNPDPDATQGESGSRPPSGASGLDGGRGHDRCRG